jgi:hypothetical protein
MNSPDMVAFAASTAERLLGDTQSDDAARLDLLYQLALTRSPTNEERDRLLGFLHAATSSNDPTSGAAEQTLTTTSSSPSAQSHRHAWVSVCQTVLASSEFRHIR